MVRFLLAPIFSFALVVGCVAPQEGGAPEETDQSKQTPLSDCRMPLPYREIYFSRGCIRGEGGHHGVDVAPGWSVASVPVLNDEAGRVTEVAIAGDYGWVVDVLGESSGKIWRYAHCQNDDDHAIKVTKGQTVARFAEICRVARPSGNATGPSVHWERRSAEGDYQCFDFYSDIPSIPCMNPSEVANGQITPSEPPPPVDIADVTISLRDNGGYVLSVPADQVPSGTRYVSYYLQGSDEALAVRKCADSQCTSFFSPFVALVTQVSAPANSQGTYDFPVLFTPDVEQDDGVPAVRARAFSE